VSVKRGLFVAPFNELSDPSLLAELASRAEARGWDGFFLWDHIVHREPVSEVSDAWVCLAAIACATERLRIGPMVTPLSRRRVQKLARETVTLDRLSRGRLVLGVGLGASNTGELAPFGDEVDARERARLLDEGLERLLQLWGGEFEPPPVQRPRIPVWVATRWPHRRPLQRAARYDGMFPIEMSGPDDLRVYLEELRDLRAAAGHDGRPYDVVVEIAPDDDTAPWEAAGATWVLDAFGSTPREADMRAAIDAGPR
jgi:alkanesulfonate monooxygenase SsuD/methylene tetrahydromethanopterin reductase-like flavin-dependent oxidoreductase (luciferase family)